VHGDGREDEGNERVSPGQAEEEVGGQAQEDGQRQAGAEQVADELPPSPTRR
jgi:hypothetical protein